MKTPNVAFLVLVVVTAACNGSTTPTSTPFPIPEGYYNAPCQQPEGTTLHEWLDNLEWYGELDPGRWDCSQVSAYIEWLTENCGYNAVFTNRLRTDTSRGHTWLTIAGNPYESTGLYWINLETADQNYYAADAWFQDIYEAIEYTESQNCHALNEWDWWITYPELMQ